MNYKAMTVTETADGQFVREITSKDTESLPMGDLLINVKYSSLNYKDALSASGNKGVTRQYPHTPGIDASGTVTESASAEFKAGDSVIVTGYDLGMNTSGGFSQYIRVPAAWPVKMPENMTAKESMMLGTAGFTAALSVHKLINAGIKPSDGEILVTGATGGVGSVAVAILSKLGYSVIAATGKPESETMLKKLGAKGIILRSELDDGSPKPMLKPRWAGAVDTVGGNILAAALKTVQYGGCVTCCGNAADFHLATTVFPFILRGVSLLGVDSVMCPVPLRTEIWKKLAGEWKPENLSEYIEEVSLEKLSEKIDLMLAGKTAGRILVNPDA